MFESILGEIIVLSAIVVGSTCAILFNTKERNRYLNFIAELEAENKKLRGKVNAAKKPIQIEEYDESNPMGAISELISGLSPLLPAAVRPFLSNKSVLEGAEKLLKEHPDEIKNVLSKLVNKKSNGKADPQQEVSSIDSMSV